MPGTGSLTSPGPNGPDAARHNSYPCSRSGTSLGQTTVLVSLDIDGTLEFGQPPGPLLLQHVHEMQRRGYIVGSASDHTIAEQRAMWRTVGIEPDFVSHKHNLTAVRAQFECSRRVHIGDTGVDEHYAHLAGFEFWHVDRLPAASASGWIY
jgi:hypothetical protein